jgi:hypothetical protein
MFRIVPLTGEDENQPPHSADQTQGCRLKQRRMVGGLKNVPSFAAGAKPRSDPRQKISHWPRIDRSGNFWATNLNPFQFFARHLTPFQPYTTMAFSWHALACHRREEQAHVAHEAADSRLGSFNRYCLGAPLTWMITVPNS